MLVFSFVNLHTHTHTYPGAQVDFLKLSDFHEYQISGLIAPTNDL